MPSESGAAYSLVWPTFLCLFCVSGCAVQTTLAQLACSATSENELGPFRCDALPKSQVQAQSFCDDLSVLEAEFCLLEPISFIRPKATVTRL